LDHSPYECQNNFFKWKVSWSYLPFKQPLKFVKLGQEKKVCKLHCVSYGLKQAPKAWYDGIDTYILFQGFVNSVNQDIFTTWKLTIKFWF